MSTKKKCTLVVVQSNGRRLTGTAAQLSHISRAGGWDSFLQQTAEEVIQDFAAAYNRRAQTPSLALVDPQKIGNEK